MPSAENIGALAKTRMLKCQRTYVRAAFHLSAFLNGRSRRPMRTFANCESI